MTDEIVSFHNQPLRVLGRNGEAFSDLVMNTLRRWAGSSERREARGEVDDKVMVLSPDSHEPWKIVLLTLNRPGRRRVFVHVCALEIGESQAIADRYAPLRVMEHMPSAVEVRLDHVPPSFFKAWSGILGEPTASDRDSPAAGDRQLAFVSTLDTVARRWATSQARGNFRALLDEARLRPQIVGRGDDDLVVLSRSYLEELADPSSARVMSQYFRGGGLSREGMPERRRRRLDPRGALPRLPDA